MHRNYRLKQGGFNAFMYFTLILFALFVLLPLVVIWSISLRPASEIVLNPFSAPDTLTFATIRRAWTSGKLGQFAVNSVIVIIPRVLIILSFASLAGFAFAKLRFFGRKTLFSYLLAGMLIPMQALMIPLYYNLNALGLRNNFIGMILAGAGLSMPFAVFFMRAFFQDLPSELLEAASIDGCSTFYAFLRIMLPLAKPGIVSLLIFQFLWGWNDFLLPLLLITDEKYRTLPLAITYFQGKYTSQTPLIAAGILIISLPVIVVFIIFQRQFTEGITVGSIKG